MEMFVSHESETILRTINWNLILQTLYYKELCHFVCRFNVQLCRDTGSECQNTMNRHAQNKNEFSFQASNYWEQPCYKSERLVCLYGTDRWKASTISESERLCLNIHAQLL